MLKKLRKAFSNPIHYKNEYLEILRRVNAGMLHHGNLECFDYAIHNLPSSNPIIEIGTFCGLSANVMTHFKKIHDKSNTLITVNQQPFTHKTALVSSSSISYSQIADYVNDTLQRNLKMFSADDLPFPVVKSSDAFFEEWEKASSLLDIFDRKIDLGGPISFAYIDGNHSYDFVLRDFKNCDAYLERGGFLFFDDSADFSEWEVCRVINLIKRNKDYRVIMKNPNYLFQKQ